MSNFIEIPAANKPNSTPILINLDKIITIKRYRSTDNSDQALLSFRYNKNKAIIVVFDTFEIRDEYYNKIRDLVINQI